MRLVFTIILLSFLNGCINTKSNTEIYKVIECANEAFLKYNENEFMYVNLSKKRWYHSYIDNTDFGIYEDATIVYSPLPIRINDMKDFIKNGINNQSEFLTPAQAKDILKYSDGNNNLITILSKVGVSGDLYFLTLSYMYSSRGGVITSFIINYKNEQCSIIKIIPGPMI